LTSTTDDDKILVEVDFVQLEICVAAVLSQDPVLLQELRDGTDLHSDNQKRFGLPTRLVAKTFVFRLLYGGSAYSYANDPDFTHVSTNKRFWQAAIDAFYAKYTGIAKWHKGLVDHVLKNKGYTSPFGREWQFRLLPSGDLPVTDIKNYIVQGTGADVVAICRVLLRKTLRDTGILFKGTIHDSILFICDRNEQDTLVKAIKETWEEVAPEIKRRFNFDWNCPSRVEIKVGTCWGELETIYKG